jgi:hypothetical protein
MNKFLFAAILPLFVIVSIFEQGSLAMAVSGGITATSATQGIKRYVFTVFTKE